jgi:F-type H+-transporting ATPase subunit a
MIVPVLATAGGGGGHGDDSGGGGGGSDWILHHVFDGDRLDIFEFFGLEIPLPVELGITKHTVFILLAGVLTFLTVWGASKTIERVPRGLRNFLEVIVKYLRDEVIYPNMGVDNGRKFSPYLLTLFLFILIMNMLGLVPFGAAATSNIYVTGALALLTLLIMIVGGMAEQGPIKFWINLVPHGVPIAVWPLLFVIELIGLIVKPFALMVRLAANMTAGHIVIFSLMSFIFTFSTIWYLIAPVSVIAMTLFFLLELLVALIQAYVFTMLSAVFIGMSLHPEH